METGAFLCRRLRESQAQRVHGKASQVRTGPWSRRSSLAPAPTACKRAARCHDSPSSRFQSEVVVAGYQGVPIGVLMQILQAQHVLQATYHSNDMPCNHEIGCRIQPFARAMEIATAATMFEEVPHFAHEGAMGAYYLLATVPARVWQGPHAPMRTRAHPRLTHARSRAAVATPAGGNAGHQSF